MSKELTVQNETSFESSMITLDNMQAMCKKLMASKHYQKMGEEGVFAVIQKAKSLGMDPIDALGGSLYYVQGKCGLSTEAMNALIRKAGHSIQKDPKSSNSICILHGKRADNGDTWTVSFSLEDAKRAGLLKNMYEKYPQIMIFNRALSMLARQLFPDVIKGAGYTLDELKEISNNNPSSSKMETTSFEDISPVVEDKITEEQVTELENLISQCSEDWQKKIPSMLQKKAYTSIADLTPEHYKGMMEFIKVKVEENSLARKFLDKNNDVNPAEEVANAS